MKILNQDITCNCILQSVQLEVEPAVNSTLTIWITLYSSYNFPHVRAGFENDIRPMRELLFFLKFLPKNYWHYALEGFFMFP
jgi:hypothetical protein